MFMFTITFMITCLRYAYMVTTITTVTVLRDFFSFNGLHY